MSLTIPNKNLKELSGDINVTALTAAAMISKFLPTDAIELEDMDMLEDMDINSVVDMTGDIVIEDSSNAQNDVQDEALMRDETPTELNLHEDTTSHEEVQDTDISHESLANANIYDANELVLNDALTSSPNIPATAPSEENVTARSVIGTDGDDTLEYEEDSYIDGKDGFDTLEITSLFEHETIDFTAIENLDAKVQNIEAIHMSENINLVINADAILDMSDDRNTIFQITGESGDGLKSTDEWTRVENQNGVEEGFIRYDGLDSSLQHIRIDVQDTITTDF